MSGDLKVDFDNPPWRKSDSVVQGGVTKNCASCALYPCLLVRNMPQATEIFGGGVFNFASPSMIPMPCGGKEWEEKRRSERKGKDRIGGAFEEFKK